MDAGKRLRIKVRNARIGDYAALVKLWKANGIMIRLGDDRDGIRTMLSHNPKLSFVAVRNGDVIGAVLGSWDGRRGWLHHLAVEKGYRKAGIATMLVTRAAKEMKSRGISMVKVEIYSRNTASKALFSKMGFKHYEKLLTYGKEI